MDASALNPILLVVAGVTVLLWLGLLCTPTNTARSKKLSGLCLFSAVAFAGAWHAWRAVQVYLQRSGPHPDFKLSQSIFDGWQFACVIALPSLAWLLYKRRNESPR